MMDFIRGSVTGDITEVPGIGPAAAKKLANVEGEEGITNTYHLIGKVSRIFYCMVGLFYISLSSLIHTSLNPKFLMLKGPDTDTNKVESFEHCEKFWYWLQAMGISAHRSAIVKAIAQKVNGLLPGVYDPDLYEDEDEEE